MRLIIAIICCIDDRGEYLQLSNHIKKTWGNQNRDEAQIFYLWANNYKKKDNNDFIANVEESYGALLKKFLYFLQHIKDWDFDYVFRVNCGSYVDIDNLFLFLKDKPKEKFYCGIKGSYGDIKFASGSGFILSKDLVELSVQYKDTFGVDHIDDISFGRFMQKHKIPLDERAIRVTWTGSGYIYQIGEKIIPENEFNLNEVYHWRLRSFDGTRYVSDCQKMKELYNLKLQNDTKTSL